MSHTKALFAGSFDPFTIGHLRIVERALRLFDGVMIGVGYNENKNTEFDLKERVEAIEKAVAHLKNVEVDPYVGLTADFAKETGCSVLLRGVRSAQDFEYERNLADANLKICGLETVLMISEPEYSYISSSLVRELLHNGKDITSLLP